MSGDTEEREVKLAVADEFALPPFTELAGVTVVDRGARRLDAVYWDTPGLDLASAGAGVRHRNGTWTYKGLSRRDGDAVVREERELDAPAARIPAALGELIARHADPRALGPVVRIQTDRHTWDLARGAEHAELVHDRVTVRDGDHSVETFTEVEVEYPPGCDLLADDVVAWLKAHGATIDGTAKYVRALRAVGHRPPEVWA